MNASAPPRRVELLQVRAPNVPSFVLALETQDDRSIAPHLRAHGVWEPAETALCQRLLRPGMRVVDAGAHAGYYSVLFSHLVGATGGVIAFEPEPANFRMLLANLLLNDCGNVEARPLALAEGRGAEFLHLCHDNPGDHRLAPVPGRARIRVETIDLDSALAGAPLDFIKIDTQGAEPRILAGMVNTISVNRERLGCLMEFAPGLLQLAGVSLDQYAAQLTALDAAQSRSQPAAAGAAARRPGHARQPAGASGRDRRLLRRVRGLWRCRGGGVAGAVSARPGRVNYARGARREEETSVPEFAGDPRADAEARFAIVASRWNPRIVDALVEGARRAFAAQGVAEAALDVIRVPGAWEIPQAAARIALGGKHAAIVALGCVVRGDTRHYEHVADECAAGLMRVALDSGVPVLNGVLAVERFDDAQARAGGARGNKGEEVALAALEMADLLRRL